jgi:hypothetical protein
MTADEQLDSNVSEDQFLRPDDLPLTGPGFCLNARSDWGALAFGFKRAADILVSEQLLIFHGGDYTVHAIVYLYRHHLELTLKEIIIKGNALLDPPVEFKLDHSIGKLWTACKLILERLDIGLENDPELTPLENSIRQLDEVDPTSESFRYPFTKSGAPTLPPALESIDIENLRRVVDGMSTFLDCAMETVRERAGDLY